MKEDDFKNLLLAIGHFQRGHQNHPTDRALSAAHARGEMLLPSLNEILTDEQQAELLAAVPKSPPPNPEG